MSKKLIFLDIDGTLTAPGKNVPPESSVEAIRRARAAGNPVFLCTGRNPVMLSPLLKYGFDGYVGCNGAFVVIGDEIVKNEPLPEPVKELLFRRLENSGAFMTIESQLGAYTSDSFKDYLRAQALETGNSEELRWREQIEKDLGIRLLSEYGGEPIFKMMIRHCPRRLLEEIREELGSGYQMEIRPGQSDEQTGCEVINAKNHKGSALLFVAERLHIPAEDTYAFGDSLNDLEMLEAAGTSVCMGNGMAALKEKADYVCPAVEDDGLFRAFETMKLF